MFEPVTPQRDESGFWTHPAVDEALRRRREEDITRLPESEGMEFVFVEFFGDAPEELERLYGEGEGLDGDREKLKRAVREWEPTVPEGAGWFLVSVHDTDDGPCACFARQGRSLEPDEMDDRGGEEEEGEGGRPAAASETFAGLTFSDITLP
jgi:hypothetical protein